MIFPSLKLEAIVQENDKTRLDGSTSYVTPEEGSITLIEIQPEAGGDFYDVTSNGYLDWEYSTEGTKVVSVRVTSTNGGPTTGTRSLDVITEADDKLFSSDADLIGHEPDILEFVRAGRNSFLDIHRMAQNRILAWLDEHRIHATDGSRLTKDAIIEIEEVAQWSKFLVLRYIFEGLSNATDDIFWEKRNRYMDLEKNARNRGRMRLDQDGDGEIDAKENLDMRSLRLVRR